MGKRGEVDHKSQRDWDQPTQESVITRSLLIDASIVVVGALAVLSWFAAHLGETWSGVAGAIFVSSGILLGLLTPLGGLIFSICSVPFQGGPVGGFIETFGVSEFARAAPIWGAVLRTVLDLARNGRNGEAPPRLLLVAALGAMLLAPLTRLTSEAYPAYQAGATGIFVDALAIVGSQSLLWGAWILAAHLPRRSIAVIENAIGIALPVALLVALAAFANTPLFRHVAFEGDRFGRLAGLGFPTPTAMGIAIALPVAAAAAWRSSRLLGAATIALSLLTIFLTESRGPLIAVILSGAVAVLLIGSVSRKLIFLGGATLAVPAIALAAQRYGRLIGEFLSGKSVELISLSDSMRIQSWIAAFEIASKRPLTGVGWMGLRFWDPKFDENHVAESHNLILHALAAGGIPYAAAMATGVIGSTVSMWRNRRGIPVHWIAAAIALLVCGAWDMPQTRAFAALFGGLALGVVARRPAAS